MSALALEVLQPKGEVFVGLKQDNSWTEKRTHLLSSLIPWLSWKFAKPEKFLWLCTEWPHKHFTAPDVTVESRCLTWPNWVHQYNSDNSWFLENSLHHSALISFPLQLFKRLLSQHPLGKWIIAFVDDFFDAPHVRHKHLNAPFQLGVWSALSSISTAAAWISRVFISKGSLFCNGFSIAKLFSLQFFFWFFLLFKNHRFLFHWTPILRWSGIVSNRNAEVYGYKLLDAEFPQCCLPSAQQGLGCCVPACWPHTDTLCWAFFPP